MKFRKIPLRFLRRRAGFTIAEAAIALGIGGLAMMSAVAAIQLAGSGGKRTEVLADFLKLKANLGVLAQQPDCLVYSAAKKKPDSTNWNPELADCTNRADSSEPNCPHNAIQPVDLVCPDDLRYAAAAKRVKLDGTICSSTDDDALCPRVALARAGDVMVRYHENGTLCNKDPLVDPDDACPFVAFSYFRAVCANTGPSPLPAGYQCNAAGFSAISVVVEQNPNIAVIKGLTLPVSARRTLAFYNNAPTTGSCAPGQGNYIGRKPDGTPDCGVYGVNGTCPAGYYQWGASFSHTNENITTGQNTSGAAPTGNTTACKLAAALCPNGARFDGFEMDVDHSVGNAAAGEANTPQTVHAICSRAGQRTCSGTPGSPLRNFFVTEVNFENRTLTCGYTVQVTCAEGYAVRDISPDGYPVCRPSFENSIDCGAGAIAKYDSASRSFSCSSFVQNQMSTAGACNGKGPYSANRIDGNGNFSCARLAGDFNNDGWPDMVFGPREGGGPRITVISGADYSTRLADFFLFGDADGRYGASPFFGPGLPNEANSALACGVAGPGGGPRMSCYRNTDTTNAIGNQFVIESTWSGGMSGGN